MRKRKSGKVVRLAAGVIVAFGVMAVRAFGAGEDNFYKLGPDSLPQEGVPKARLIGPATLPSEGFSRNAAYVLDLCPGAIRSERADGVNCVQ